MQQLTDGQMRVHGGGLRPGVSIKRNEYIGKSLRRAR
jgi:hypothetical protein